MKDWRKQARERVKEKTRGNKFKLEAGTNSFRILPNAKGDEYPPFYEYYIHRNVGKDKRLVTCGKRIDGGGECWLCDEVIPALNKKNKAIRAKALNPVEQILVQVARVTEDGEMKGPLPFFVPTAKSVSTQILGVLGSTKRQYEHPKKGYNLSMERSGTGPRDTRYGTLISDEEPSRVPKAVLGKLKPFEQIVEPYDEEVQRAAYYGREVDESRRSRNFEEEEDDMPVTKKKKHDDEDEDIDDEEEDDVDGDDDDDDDDDEPKSKKKKSKVKSKKKSKKSDDDDDDDDEDEDDDDDDEDEDDDDDDDEPKSKKKKSKVKSKKKSKKSDDDDDEDDDDDDEDDDDEDDEDEKPSKKSKKKSKKSDDDDDDDDDDDEDDEDDDDDDDEPKSKKKSKKAPAKAAKPAKKKKK